MTRADIINELARQVGLTRTETKAIVDGVFNSIINGVVNGKRIELRGFGVFNVKSRKPRLARNPKTGEEVILEKRFITTFKASPDFTKLVNKTISSK